MTNPPDPTRAHDNWANGAAYENFVGRWSRLIAAEFLSWLEVPAGVHWLDVGCGTGMLSRAILQTADPASVKGIDRSQGYIALAQAAIQDRRAAFETGDAQALPVEKDAFEAVVSGLMLNFLPQPERGAAEMARAARPGGRVAAYVWDYAGKMQFMRHFWNAAAALDSRAYDLDEGRRFPVCHAEPLKQLFLAVGLKDVDVRHIDIATDFRDFDDFWSPFLGGEGPASGYVKSLSVERQAALRERIRAALPTALDGSIPLVARAWAVRGVR